MGSTVNVNLLAIYSLAILVALASIVAVGIWFPSGRVLWLGFAAWMLGVLVVASQGITNTPWGLLIDDRNRMSLSRLQMVLWMLAVLSAYLAAAIGNIRAGNPNPVLIALPETVWILMGINTTALVGSSLLLGVKRGVQPVAPIGSPNPPPNVPGGGPSPLASLASTNPRLREMPGLAAAALRMQGEDPSKMAVDGSVVLRDAPTSARLSDLFKGDEATDVATIDLSKVQLFLITVVLMVSYTFAIAAKFSAAEQGRVMARAPVGGNAVSSGAPTDPKWIDQFPPLDVGFVTMLGISNAGLLANKTVPRS